MSVRKQRLPTQQELTQERRADDFRSVIRGTLTHEEYSRRWADEDRKRLERLPLKRRTVEG